MLDYLIDKIFVLCGGRMFQQTIGLIDKIFVLCGGRVFQQTIGIPMGANCASLLANLFLHDYQADFLQSSSQSG
jgi:hypothetical protein